MGMSKPEMLFSHRICRIGVIMSKSQTRMAAKLEAIDLLRRLYDKLRERYENEGGAFAYGTLNGIALARSELEIEMR